jgi:asparagine synthase (glutamine-hydrolysing)
MRAARAKGTIVILNGQGADETLAGYWNYVFPYWTELVRRGEIRRAWHEMWQYCRSHNRPLAQALRDVLLSAAKGAVRDRLPDAWVPEKAATSDADTAWSSPDLIDRLPPRGDPHVRDLRTATLRSVAFRPLPIFLRVEDRNSMAHSVEARLPFMDYRVVELAFSLPSSWKVRAPWNKYVLREAMRGVIPDTVRTRLDKMGFPTSARRWIASPWHEPMQDLFASQSFRERGVFNVPALRAALSEHRNGADRATPLFAAAEFELWCRQHVGGGGLGRSQGQAA